MSWTCPECGRPFARTGQSHQCEPALTLGEYFDGRDPEERAIYEAVAEVLEPLGPVTIEPVGVGILFRRSRTFVELRPKPGRIQLTIVLPYEIDHPRIRRVARPSRRQPTAPMVHYIDLHEAGDVDEEVIGWLEESLLETPE
jgi:hypothetical protein